MKSARIPIQDQEKIWSLAESGFSLREISRSVGRSKGAVMRYARDIDRPALCKCGKPNGHQGWCNERLARSPKRKEYLDQFHKPDIAIEPPAEIIKPKLTYVRPKCCMDKMDDPEFLSELIGDLNRISKNTKKALGKESDRGNRKIIKNLLKTQLWALMRLKKAHETAEFTIFEDAEVAKMEYEWALQRLNNRVSLKRSKCVQLEILKLRSKTHEHDVALEIEKKRAEKKIRLKFDQEKAERLEKAALEEENRYYDKLAADQKQAAKTKKWAKSINLEARENVYLYEKKKYEEKCIDIGINVMMREKVNGETFEIIDIAEIVGCPAGRINDIYESAMKKIRAAMQSKGIQLHDLLPQEAYETVVDRDFGFRDKTLQEARRIRDCGKTLPGDRYGNVDIEYRFK